MFIFLIIILCKYDIVSMLFDFDVVYLFFIVIRLFFIISILCKYDNVLMLFDNVITPFFYCISLFC